jgi:outer membrane receptor for ferrienterochelin and colicin
MRTNPQLAAYAAIKLTVISNAVSYSGLGHAQQDEPNKTLEKITVSAGWLGSSTLDATKKQPGTQTIITTQELTESGVRDLNPLCCEVAQ